ncbi:hypothetical protein SADUNF_Sadunf04G0082700 [Salix dunnii]|uniref:Uncharacterized protein n=1 Tax=Salix dunnii TaxID=1413687 RepID=A0A835KAS1_9ROSI|nr:hypothetical protein SADUNF_Sadunf04G0082700 [Salix dunnii]
MHYIRRVLHVVSIPILLPTDLGILHFLLSKQYQLHQLKQGKTGKHPSHLRPLGHLPCCPGQSEQGMMWESFSVYFLLLAVLMWIMFGNLLALVQLQVEFTPQLKMVNNDMIPAMISEHFYG